MTVKPATANLLLHRPLSSLSRDARSENLVRLLSSGGDARITLDPETGLNRYLSGPYPRDVVAYSSSTISDISPEAFAHLLAIRSAGEGDYPSRLDALRSRIRAAYEIEPEAAQVVFAPSGTDLEYVALACVRGKASGGVHNVLLGADETGSGCIHSAHGRYFAKETALDVATVPAQPVEGMGDVSLVDIPVRCSQGIARSSDAVIADMADQIDHARTEGRHCLIHCVHGSKTGLVLPMLDDVDALLNRFGPSMTVVVDACQARITSPAIKAYLERGCIVLMTGSKFIGAPPFNSWALVPPSFGSTAQALPEGFKTIFRKAEWPVGWAGREGLEDSANDSLALRLEAAMFEVERFQSLALDTIEGLIDLFEAAVQSHLIGPLGLRRVLPAICPEGLELERPIEMRTLITLDMTGLPGLVSLEDAQTLHRALALDGVRLGQPVKCVRTGQSWGATLRVGLSMPHMIRWAQLPIETAREELERDMSLIAQAIAEKTGSPIVG